MNLVDLVVGIVVVTILVTVMVGVVTYVAYKLRMAREPESPWEEEETRYFVRYDPGDLGATGEEPAMAGSSPGAGATADGTGPATGDAAIREGEAGS